MDNDPKNFSGYAADWMREILSTAESPDLNLIKNLWQYLKDYTRIEIKPKS